MNPLRRLPAPWLAPGLAVLLALLALPAAAEAGRGTTAPPPGAVVPALTGLPAPPDFAAAAPPAPASATAAAGMADTPAAGGGEIALPPLRARVTDLSSTLTAEQRGRLEARLEAFERERGGQIVVLLLPTTQPESIEQFGSRLAEAWKPGRRGVDNGIIVIVATADRRMRIEVGYGYEGSVPDAVAKRIVAERMAPRFAQGDFAGGLLAGVDALAAATAGEPIPAPPARRAAAASAPGGENFLIAALVVAALAGTVLRLIFGDLLGAGITGAGTGAVGWFLSGSLQVAGLAALGGIVAALFGLSLALNVLTRGRGGGFSGGGGGFGGGGASGRW